VRRYFKAPATRILLALAVALATLWSPSGATADRMHGKKPPPRTKLVKGGGPARAFVVLRELVPDETTLLLGIQLAAVRGTELGARLRQIGETKDDLRELLGKARAACGVDPLDSVHDIALAFLGGDVVVAASMRGFGERELTACAEKMAAAEEAKLSIDRRGTRIGYDLGGQRFEVAWPTADVLVFASSPDDGVVLERMIAGRGAFARRPEIVRASAAIALTGLVYFVHASREVSGAEGTTGAAGQAVLADKSLKCDAQFFAVSGDAARTLSSEWNQELSGFANGAGPPLFARLLAGVKIYAEGDLVRIKADFGQKDLLELMQLLGGGP
jgi:hypothetical protein